MMKYDYWLLIKRGIDDTSYVRDGKLKVILWLEDSSVLQPEKWGSRKIIGQEHEAEKKNRIRKLSD